MNQINYLDYTSEILRNTDVLGHKTNECRLP